MNGQYPWYEVVDGKDLMQGDLIDNCQVVLPSPGEQAGDGDIPPLNVDIDDYDVVILSQSCDLANAKVELVLVCPVRSLAEFGESEPHFATPKGKEQLRRGATPGYHLLNECDLEGFHREFRVVDFRWACALPIEFLRDLAVNQDKRLRLLPPYREHLAQAFARFFMRVGLPIDIPPFK